MLSDDDIKKLKQILATKADIVDLAAKKDLVKFATKEDLDKFATRDDLVKFEAKINQKFTHIIEKVSDLDQKIDTVLEYAVGIEDERDESTRDLTVGVSSLDRTSSDSGKPATLQSGFYRDKNEKRLRRVETKVGIIP